MNNTYSQGSAMPHRLLFLLLCFIALSTAPLARAQVGGTIPSSAQDERVALHQALLDLSNPWTVMCIAAHPDDEDGATLTVLRRKYGVHTVSVFSTYGEGGQNAIGPELYEELGAIRARETLAAAEIQGSEAFFLALRDFGFSKSADEAFRIWGHDEALRRMVLKIRTLHPDVIITNHDTVSGHGHHQATGRLVLEAFDAAADPRRFPEQLSKPGVSVWQAQRLFVRINYEGGAGSKAEEEAAERAGKTISIKPNERDAVRGTTYAEQALQALHQHASQGPWPANVPKDGAPVIRYRLAREAKMAAPLPARPQTFLDALHLPAESAGAFVPPTIDNRPLTEFVNQRERVVDALVAARENWPSLSRLQGADESRFQLMSERLNRALAEASGFHLSLTPREATITPDAPVYFSLRLMHTGAIPVQLHDVITGCWQDFHSLDSYKHKVPPILSGQFTQDVPEATYAPADAFVNVPRAEHLYDEHLFGQQCSATASLEANGTRFKIASKIRLDVAPVIEIASIQPSPLVLTPAIYERFSTFTLRLINHRDAPFEGQINSERLSAAGRRSRGMLVEPLAVKSFRLEANEMREVSLKVDGLIYVIDSEQSGKPPAPAAVALNVLDKRRTTPTTTRKAYLAYSEARIAPNLRVGYVRSFDDTLRNALTALGVEAKELTVDDVRTGDLKSYDTIIIDNRGYQAHPELVAANPRLLEYVSAGGTLVVFYHKTGEWNPDPKKNRPQLAPYPIILDSARVTDESAPVTFTEPQSALLNFPNKIMAQDFAGWIQERGLYYPKEWDAHYSAPLAMSDAGEAPLRGGLLAAEYGRGHYIYTSMVWYRQLRAGIPGAYRVFANLISYGRAGVK